MPNIKKVGFVTSSKIAKVTEKTSVGETSWGMSTIYINTNKRIHGFDKNELQGNGDLSKL